MFGMIERPRFKSHYQVEVRGAGLVVATSERRAEVLEGRLHPLLAPWMDGTRDAAALAAAAGDGVGPLDADFGIGLLEERGLIEEGGAAPDPWRSALQERTGARDTGAARIAVEGDQAAAALLTAALASLGLFPGTPADLTLVLTSDYLQSGIERDAPWMPVKAAGTVLWFGPVFDGSAGACWECLATRLREWRRAEAWVPERTSGDDLRPSAPLPPFALHLALGLAALEACHYLSHNNPDAARTLVTFDMAAMRLDRHPVTANESCPQCGRGRAPDPSPIRTLRERSDGDADTLLRRIGQEQVRRGTGPGSALVVRRVVP